MERYLLNELRLQNNAELDEKRSLDSKSSNIAGYSVTFTVLLFGFGSFLLEKIETTNQVLFASITMLLIIGIFLSIFCVICSVRAFRLQEYRYVLTETKFFLENSLPADSKEWQKHLNTREIKSWIDDFPKQEDYEDFMIREHLVTLRYNVLANNNKATWIERAQILFISAICVTPTILLVVLAGFLLEMLKVE